MPVTYSPVLTLSPADTGPTLRFLTSQAVALSALINLSCSSSPEEKPCLSTPCRVRKAATSLQHLREIPSWWPIVVVRNGGTEGWLPLPRVAQAMTTRSASGPCDIPKHLDDQSLAPR